MTIIETDLGKEPFEKMLKTSTNKQNNNPLLLSAYLGQVDIFKVIIEHEVRCTYTINMSPPLFPSPRLLSFYVFY